MNINLIKRTVLSIIMILISYQIFAQSKSDILKSYLIDNQNYEKIRAEILADTALLEQHLTLIIPYYQDTLSFVRIKAYRLTGNLATTISSVESKQKIVAQLLKGVKDKHTGVVGVCLSSLTNFAPEDFDESAKDMIKKYLQEKTIHYDLLIRLVGYLQLKDQSTNLQVLVQGTGSPKIKWAARLALARMGNQQALNDCIMQIKKLPVNDDVVYEVLPDLVYIRQKEAITYLVELLQSEEKNCEPADPDMSQKIQCGYRIMEYLAPIIKDFPLQIDISGDLMTNNYKKALETARSWFNTNPDYQIITDKY